MFNQDENRRINSINENNTQIFLSSHVVCSSPGPWTVTVKSHFVMIFGENATKVYYKEQNM